MTDVLAHRGPDGQGVWSDGPIGLGHRMLWTSPHPQRERLPLVSTTGDLVLTADARIDNRRELLSALGRGAGTTPHITDSELILAAYERWGERCAEKLLGDFAFAIWDRRRRTVFCARDHFGVKPFYYHCSGRAFVFASEIKALLRVPEVPRRLNEVRVGEYLAGLFEDTTITFYQGILRLPPGHSMTVSSNGERLRKYWGLDPSRELRLSSEEEYDEAFREVFTEAVRCRLTDASQLGSFLSGGLDSSSVTCVARDILSTGGGSLETFSAVYPDLPQCDERTYIDSVLAQNNVEPHFVIGDDLGPLTDLERVVSHQDEPFYAPNLFAHWGVLDAVARRGVRTVLDGFDGDTALSHVFGYLDELARSGHWLRLAEEARGLAKTFDVSPWATIWSYGQDYGVGRALTRSVGFKTGRRVGRAVLRHLSRGSQGAARRGGPMDLLNPEFVNRTTLAERHRAGRRAERWLGRSEREQHGRNVSHGFQPFALEVLDRAAAAFSIEVRYPFWDKRLIEFCLALPPQQKLHKGWSRMVMRRAMAGILPSEVQWRRTKSNFFPSFARGLKQFRGRRLDDIVDGSPGFKDYVDIGAFRKAFQRSVSLGSQDAPDNAFAVWRALDLALWLQHDYQGSTASRKEMATA